MINIERFLRLTERPAVFLNTATSCTYIVPGAHDNASVLDSMCGEWEGVAPFYTPLSRGCFGM